MKILVTGSEGFIGKNFCQKLIENNIIFFKFNRNSSIDDLKKKIDICSFIFHFAGVNKPDSNYDFEKDNINLTKLICKQVLLKENSTTIIFSSSIQAEQNNLYGKSKKKCEDIFESIAKHKKINIIIYRLNGIFGKWSKPNYNSVVSTFCHNAINHKKNNLIDPEKILSLTYIDDLLIDFINILKIKLKKNFLIKYPSVIHKIKVKDIDKLVSYFHENRTLIMPNKIGSGIKRKVYATYLSFLKESDFVYNLNPIIDDRGKFVEILKLKDTGQISYITINPGYSRGGHYHHTKSEKFSVLKGAVTFIYKNILTRKKFKINLSEKSNKIIESIPGWRHEIINSSNDIAIILIWANECFDKDSPDTYVNNK